MVSYEYYTQSYLGSVAAEADFAMLEARAEDIVNAATRYAVTCDTIETLPAIVRDLYRKAVCAQADYIALNGVESVITGTVDSFTVGKVSVNAGSGSTATKAGGLSLSPLAATYLEQSGLLYAGVSVSMSGPALMAGWYPC